MTHLRAMIPAPWRASLLAVDGATTHGLEAQLRRLPADASHLAVSIGGNDVLGHFDLLSSRVASTGEALDLFTSRVNAFERDYAEALELVQAVGLPATVCTIYEGALPDPLEASRARTALTLFNDVILRTAWRLRQQILELRLVCTERADYANPIEPSGRGGWKIARALGRAAGALDESEPAVFDPHVCRTS